MIHGQRIKGIIGKRPFYSGAPTMTRFALVFSNIFLFIRNIFLKGFNDRSFVFNVRANVSGPEERIHTSSTLQAKKMVQMSMDSGDREMIRLNRGLFSLAKVFSHPTKI